MADAITAIFCTLCMASGWYYLARSRGVERLSMLESPRRNTTRRKARRMGAWSMILIGASGFWLMFEVGRAGPPIRVALAMILVTVALLTMLMCAMVDVYLTMRLRQSNRGPKMIRARRLKFSIVCLATLLTGCEADTTATTQPADAPTIDVVLAGRQFKLEVADEEKEREVGLMHRKSMPVDHGMLFAFPDLKPRTFWMKNTLLPLDIAFLDENGLVLNVAQMEPNDLTNVPSRGPAKYAIELNQGVAERIGLKSGDAVTLPTLNAR